MKYLITLFVLSVALIASAATPLTPVPLPQKGSCPFGFSSDSRYCTPGNGAKFNIFLRVQVDHAQRTTPARALIA